MLLSRLRGVLSLIKHANNFTWICGACWWLSAIAGVKFRGTTQWHVKVGSERVAWSRLDGTSVGVQNVVIVNEVLIDDTLWTWFPRLPISRSLTKSILHKPLRFDEARAIRMHWKAEARAMSQSTQHTCVPNVYWPGRLDNLSTRLEMRNVNGSCACEPEPVSSRAPQKNFKSSFSLTAFVTL